MYARIFVYFYNLRHLTFHLVPLYSYLVIRQTFVLSLSFSHPLQSNFEITISYCCCCCVLASYYTCFVLFCCCCWRYILYTLYAFIATPSACRSHSFRRRKISPASVGSVYVRIRYMCICK